MNSSTTNVLIVILLLLLVGFGVWYFTAGRAPTDGGPDLRVDVDAGGGGPPSGGGSSY
jgi:hypothetical protein